MNVGIVTTWFERGAAYVSKVFENVLSYQNDLNVFIYARGGEEYGIGDPNWDKLNVTWGKKLISPFSSTVLDKNDFRNWIKQNDIELILFNEQHWFQPLLWCKEWKIKTIAYIDYYTEETIPLHDVYDCVICNTRRHYFAFRGHHNPFYIPWGINLDLYQETKRSLVNDDYVTFFHSCGWDTYRKGTDLLIRAFDKTRQNSRLIIHAQKPIEDVILRQIIDRHSERITVIIKTVHAPGLYYLGDVYVYPSRLEGIGLTVPEAIASGLAVVVPNNPPMNEFANHDIAELIDISYLYSRYDGYYWPKCEIDVDHLAAILDDLSIDKERVVGMKRAARSWAETYLDMDKNFSSLPNIVRGVEFKPLDGATKKAIDAYDNKGMKRFHRLYLSFYPLFNTIRNIIK